jgi:hypothetical protein
MNQVHTIPLRKVLKLSSLVRFCTEIISFLRDFHLKTSYEFLIFLFWYMGFALITNVNTGIGSSLMGQAVNRRKFYKILVRNPEGMRQIEKPRFRQKDIKIDFM